MALVSLHSCYMLVINSADVDAFYAACGADQMMRTNLDWVSDTEKNVPEERVIAETEYSAQEATFARQVEAVATKAIKAA